MPQHRLEHYFTPSYAPFIPSGCSFLDLPESVRKLVYKYAGLDDIMVDLNYSNLKVYAKGTYPETADCRKLTPGGYYDLKKLDVAEPDEVWEVDEENKDRRYGTSLWGNGYGLHQSMLLASKQIHQEVEAFTYTGASFRVCLGQPLGFKRLWRMSDGALSNLTSLTIRLDVPRTIVREEAWDESPTLPEYIDISNYWGKKVLKDWISTLERLARVVGPGQLSLRVVFCAKTMSEARAIIEPMTQLPLLKDCGICAEVYGQNVWWRLRLRQFGNPYIGPSSINADTELSRFVQSIIGKLTLIPNRERAPFRYLDLPQEIRFAILEYTDLIAPDGVQWRPRKRIEKSSTCTRWETVSNATTESKPPCSCHSSPSLNMDDYVFYHPCCQKCGTKGAPALCYCSARGPIWSSSCECPLPRQTLFSVSRRVRQDAISVYYSYNQIFVTPYHSPSIQHTESWWKDWPAASLHSIPKVELSLYLSSVARNALRHIHWLEWILPTSQRSYLLPGTPTWSDYLDTLLLMQNAMNLPALTFVINISASGHALWDSDVDVAMPLNDDAWRWYETITLPVRRLGEAGLKDFFVHLRRCDGRVEQEESMEKAVMGKDYSSQTRGKPVERMDRLLQEAREKEFETYQ